ncbi:MAG: outer membrane beta-barrel protein [Nitrospirota bacterium]
MPGNHWPGTRLSFRFVSRNSRLRTNQTGENLPQPPMKHLSFIRWIIASHVSISLAFAGEPSLDNSKSTAIAAPASRISLSGWVEAGITANFASPNDRQNFGRLLDDWSNEPLLNQFVVAAEQMLDPKAADRFDWGFKVELFYGSDARYLHSTGLLDLTTNDTVQPDIPEAWVLAHFPISGTAGGLDLKLGKFMNCFGADMSDPRTNVFYSHSYIFNFGCPFYGTGGLLKLHAAPGLDIYGSVDRGLNVAVEDNNDSASFYGGVMMNCCNGKVSCAAMITPDLRIRVTTVVTVILATLSQPGRSRIKSPRSPTLITSMTSLPAQGATASRSI